MELKPYEKYKDSGIAWLGDIPDGWEIKKLKRLFQVINGATPKSGVDEYWDGEIVWITPADYDTDDKFIYNGRRKITQAGLDSCATRIVQIGSLVVSNRAPIGLVCISAVPLCTNQGCKALTKIADIDTRYYYYYISVQQDLLNALGKGTTFLELSAYDLGGLIAPLPPIQEQTTIADYLDAETARISRIIALKNNLITHLREKRTAIISHAVTKGIYHDVKMKPSGIEWIGDIPDRWEVKKLRFLGTLDASGVDKKIRDGEDLYKSVHYMDVYRNRLSQISNSDEYLIVSADLEKAEKCNLKKGDILFTNSSETPEDIGHSTAISEDLVDTLFGYHLMRFRPACNLYLQYEKYLFGSTYIRGWFDSRAKGITRFGINYVDFADTLIIMPPISEQTAIADYLDAETTKIDAIIEKTKQSIEKLKEYQTSLISACVTGKIDVRSV